MWYHYVAYFFGGAFLGNAIPHFVSGATGRAFPTPFASPPGKGLSSAWVNVLWGMFNALIGYLLTFKVGTFDVRNALDAGAAGVGVLVMALMLAHAFAPLHTKN